MASTRHLNQLRVHVKTSEDLGVPFYILPDVLPTQSIPVSRHRNRYQGHLGSTHSISRRHGDSDLVFSPATNSVTCVAIRSQSLPLNGWKWKWKEEPSSSKAPRPIKKGVDHPCGFWRVTAPAPWAKRWPAMPPNAFASPSVIKRASNRQERRKDGSKKVGWVSTLWAGKAGYQAARVGAGKAIQSDLDQKKAMEFISPLVGDTLDKLGSKVGGEEVMKQLGAGSPIYQSGTDPYREGGLLPLLALGGGLMIHGLMKQLDAGSPAY